VPTIECWHYIDFITEFLLADARDVKLSADRPSMTDIHRGTFRTTVKVRSHRMRCVALPCGAVPCDTAPHGNATHRIRCGNRRREG